MKAAVSTLIASGATLLALLSQPEAVAACIGRSLTFDEAIRMSDGAIYAGRIIRADYRAYAFDINMDVELVVRGHSLPRLRRAEAGSFCDGIEPGQWGYIVRDVRDPAFPTGPDDLFFRVGRFYAQTALASAGLPDTATLLDPEHSAAYGPIGWLAVLVGTASFLVAYRRSPSRTKVSPGDISEH